MVYIVLLTLFSVLFALFTSIFARIYSQMDQKGMSKTKKSMYIFMNCQRPQNVKHYVKKSINEKIKVQLVGINGAPQAIFL